MQSRVVNYLVMLQENVLEITVLFFALIGVFATVRWLRGLLRKLVSTRSKPIKGGQSKSKRKRKPQPARGVARESGQPGYVVDGSNVLFWAGDGPDLASVQAVVSRLKSSGKDLHVFFDATIGYKLFDRHVNAAAMAAHLNLAAQQVTIVPGGTDADIFILKHAARHRDTVVSNDRFKDNTKLAKGLPRLRGVVSGGRVVFDG